MKKLSLRIAGALMGGGMLLLGVVLLAFDSEMRLLNIVTLIVTGLVFLAYGILGFDISEEQSKSKKLR